jgi:single-stranded-DNA-specific exonuclease
MAADDLRGPPAPALTRPWRAAGQTVRRWLRAVPPKTTIAVVVGPHPDGLAAAAIVRQGLRRAGRSVTLVTPARGATAWDAEMHEGVAAMRPSAVVAAGIGGPTDWPLDVPALVIDRRPLPVAPPGVTTISGAGWAPPPSTSSLAYWLMQGVADVRRLDWIAAVGTMGALGEQTDHALANAARKAHGAGALRDLLVLLRGAGRAAEPAAGAAVGLLSRARDPKDALLADRPERSRLIEAGDEVEAAIDSARDRPALALAPLALVRVSSPCLIHGVIATMWQGRQPGAVLVGNDRYLAGRVAFAATGPPGTLVILPEGATPDLATVDDPTVAGHLAVGDWLRLLQQRGVPAGVWRAPRGTSGAGRTYV